MALLRAGLGYVLTSGDDSQSTIVPPTLLGRYNKAIAAGSHDGAGQLVELTWDALSGCRLR